MTETCLVTFSFLRTESHVNFLGGSCCILFKEELFKRRSVNTLLEFKGKQVANFDYFGELSLKGPFCSLKRALGAWGISEAQRL